MSNVANFNPEKQAILLTAEEAIDELYSEINCEVLKSTTPVSMIIPTVMKLINYDSRDEEDSETVMDAAERILKDAVDSKRKKEEHWPEMTDCDRLDKAFERFNEYGLLAHKNYMCCSGCAIPKIRQELNDAVEEGVISKGFVYYSDQDINCVLSGGFFALHYRSIEEDDDKDILIGFDIVKMLYDAGLDSMIDINHHQIIFSHFSWNKRLIMPIEDDANLE